MRLILLGGYFGGGGGMWKNVEKRRFFRPAMAGLGKYYMGGYGRIGVYRGSKLQPTYMGKSIHSWQINAVAYWLQPADMK